MLVSAIPFVAAWILCGLLLFVLLGGFEGDDGSTVLGMPVQSFTILFSFFWPITLPVILVYGLLHALRYIFGGLSKAFGDAWSAIVNSVEKKVSNV